MANSAARPPATTGMRHVALNVADVQACRGFYVDIMGMRIEWQPDAENLYLTSGNDNLALHKSAVELPENSPQRLDHIGFILRKAEDVDLWYDFLCTHGVRIVLPPKTHRDGARSFYCLDPENNRVQIIYHPPIADF